MYTQMLYDSAALEYEVRNIKEFVFSSFNKIDFLPEYKTQDQPFWGIVNDLLYAIGCNRHELAFCDRELRMASTIPYCEYLHIFNINNDKMNYSFYSHLFQLQVTFFE